MKYTVRACTGKYNAAQLAAIKKLWQQHVEATNRKKRKKEDGEAVLVLDGGRPPFPLDPSEEHSSQAASTSQRTLPEFYNIARVRDGACSWG